MEKLHEMGQNRSGVCGTPLEVSGMAVLGATVGVSTTRTGVPVAHHLYKKGVGFPICFSPISQLSPPKILSLHIFTPNLH